MRSMLLPLYRVLGAFWLKRRTGVYARFVESRAYGPTIAVIALGGLFLVVGGTVVLVRAPALAALWFVVSALSWLLVMAFLTSFGATAVHSSEHAATPKELLARCGELLEQHGFAVKRTRTDRLRCTRGKKTLAETEWRSFPLEGIVTAKPAGSVTTLSVQCTVAVTAYRFIRELVEKTSKAVTELDAVALAALDKTLVFRQRALVPGGLARTIFIALTISALLTALTLTGLISAIGTRYWEDVKTGRLWWRAYFRVDQLSDGIDLPFRLELDRYLSRVAQEEPIGSPEEVLRGFKSAEGHFILLAVRRNDGSALLLHPEVGNPLRPLVQAQALITGDPEGLRLQRVGDRVFKPLPILYRLKIQSTLGLQNGRLEAGSFHTFDDLARRAGYPYFATNTELTFFDQGTSVVRYRWGGPFDDVTVDEGASEIPEEVMRASMTVAEWEFTLKDVLIRPDWADTIRTEFRDGKEYDVVYIGKASPRGWSGISYAVPAPRETGSHDEYLNAVFLVGFIGLVVVLFLMTFFATVISGRIARPVLQVRDALRSIAEGDYSVRVKSNRTDEIGQLQKLVNQTAEELRKRESIKDLLGKYLSKQVADRIMQSDTEGALAGARKEVSVLFADVRGFTSYAERHDPEQVTRSLNEYFEVMVDVIASHEGVLDKYIGDGLMVVFGAPMAQPDHASRAVITALEMQAALQSLNLKRVQRGDEPISIGIGVNTGLAISGNLGSIKRMEFTVIGDTVNLAARLEASAGQGQTLIGRATYEKVKDLILSEPMGQVTLKGKTEPVDVWLVTGLKRAPGRSGH